MQNVENTESLTLSFTVLVRRLATTSPNYTKSTRNLFWQHHNGKRVCKPMRLYTSHTHTRTRKRASISFHERVHQPSPHPYQTRLPPPPELHAVKSKTP